MELLIAGGRVIDPAQGMDRIADLLIRDGRIMEIGRDLSKTAPSAARIEAAGLVVAPGLVDMHVHLRDPGQTRKEDIVTGTRAAAKGGVTSLACMPNTVPVADCPEVIDYIIQKAKAQGCVNVYPIGAVSLDQEGKTLTDAAALKQAGAVALSDDGHPVANAALMREAMVKASAQGLTVISHCEEPSLAAGAVNEGAVSADLQLPGIPKEAEEIMVAREIVLSENLGLPVHIAHISTKGSAALIRDAKARGVKVTCETCPHYLLLTEEAVRDCNTCTEKNPPPEEAVRVCNTNAKMNPPLRTEDDRQALLRAVADGTADAIATDHAPHHADEKARPFAQAPNGVTGLETLLSASLTALYVPGLMSLPDLIRRLTSAPAAILGLPKGTLKPGSEADIVIFDPEKAYTVTADGFASKAANSPYIGMELTGSVQYTLVGGKIVYQANA